MPSKTINNIYLEHFIANRSAKEVWNEVVRAPYFQTLFPEPTFSFVTNQKGKLYWKRSFFVPVEGEYSVESSDKDKHLLLQIKQKECSSLLLFVFEEDKNGVLFRLEHRSFSGSSKIKYYKSFQKRWNKFSRSFANLQKK